MELSWHTFTCTVQGASHVRVGRPNQDSVSAEPERGESKCAIISVADGHGSAEYLRSQIGSKLAVKATIGVLINYVFAPSQPQLTDKDQNLRPFQQLAVERVPQEIAKRWRTAVKEHLSQHPLGETEKEKLDALPPSARGHVQSEVSLYGTTVLGVVATKDYVLYLQNGDGDILVLQRDGSVRRPLPGDSRLFGNETTSLAAERSWQDFRVRFEPTGSKPPLLILAATDGYANSFGSDEDFLQVPRDLFTNLNERGMDWTFAQIPRWLDETSIGGSSDDISIGMIWREGKDSKAADAALEHGAESAS